MNEKILKSCGENPNKDQIITDVGNDPNFVFENDPLFETKVLYDADGNVVNVNSWVECAHYVEGGWSSSNTSSLIGDKVIFSGLLVVTFIYIILRRAYYAKNK